MDSLSLSWATLDSQFLSWQLSRRCSVSGHFGGDCVAGCINFRAVTPGVWAIKQLLLLGLLLLPRADRQRWPPSIQCTFLMRWIAFSIFQFIFHFENYTHFPAYGGGRQRQRKRMRERKRQKESWGGRAKCGAVYWWFLLLQLAEEGELTHDDADERGRGGYVGMGAHLQSQQRRVLNQHTHTDKWGTHSARTACTVVQVNEIK